jgi:hypothetical protein
VNEPVKDKPVQSSQKTPDIQESSATSKSVSGDGSTDSIKNQWKDIRIAAKEISPETAALLNSCRSTEIKNGRVVLGFSSSVLRDKMETGQNLDNARKAIKQVTGADLPIDCRVAGKEERAVPEGMNVDHEGMVGAALRLGGKITKEE